MSEFTQGICADGAAILKDGVMLTVEEIIELLRQGDKLMGMPEPAIVFESLTIKEAKEHLVKGITYAQRANEASGLYKPKLNPKMGEQQ